jgi:hypothetical protein
MGVDPATRETREASLRDLISQLRDDADDPQLVAAALVGIRKELRGSSEGPADVVKVRSNFDLQSPTTAAAASETPVPFPNVTF